LLIISLLGIIIGYKFFQYSLAIFKVSFKIIMSSNTKHCLIPSPFSSCITGSVYSSVGKSTIETTSGNVPLDRSKSDKVSRKSSSQTGNESSKRKQVALDSNTGNEPPQHKNIKILKTLNESQNKLGGKLTQAAKGDNKCPAKNKLITGQTKLTQFFRL
jgi:hypothetical protein